MMHQVAILLCTYQRQNYLADQLDSFAAQIHTHWKVWASDDGSTDKTLAILSNYQQQWGEQKLVINRGPCRGFAANFLSLTCNANIQADYYAYSDDDDVWEADKLQRAVRWLETVSPGRSALYCSRLRLVSANQQALGLSPLYTKPPSFSNALVQAMGSGNTIVFNHSARQLLLEAGADVKVITHDWWAYLVVVGCGGEIFYDPHPTIRYRQHGGNIVGMNLHWRARWLRAYRLCRGSLSEGIDRNIAALRRLTNRLTPKNRQLLDKFVVARQSSLLPRLLGFWQVGLYRHTGLDNVALFIAAFLKRI